MKAVRLVITLAVLAVSASVAYAQVDFAQGGGLWIKGCLAARQGVAPRTDFDIP